MFVCVFFSIFRIHIPYLKFSNLKTNVWNNLLKKKRRKKDHVNFVALISKVLDSPRIILDSTGRVWPGHWLRMFSRCQCVFREVNSLWSVILFYFLDEISTNWLDGELYNIESQDARQLSTPAKPITSGGKRRSFEKWKRVKITLSKIPFCLPCFKFSMCLYHYKRIGKGIVMCANLCVFFFQTFLKKWTVKNLNWT